MNPKIIKAIAVTAELTGTELSEASIRVMESDLAQYPESAVLRALDRCRKELTSRLTLKHVLDRVVDEDGRPGPEEAWSRALTASDESATVLWNDEMARAMEAARPALEVRDKVAARVAFCEVYNRLVREAREAHTPCNWFVSLGTDVDGREAVVTAAIAEGKILPSAATHLLGPPKEGCDGGFVAALLAGDDRKALEHVEEVDRDVARRGILRLRQRMAELEREAQARMAAAQEQIDDEGLDSVGRA